MTDLDRCLTVALVLVAVSTAGGCGRDRPAPVAPPPDPAAVAVELVWGTEWDAALARAAAEQRPVVVVFSADWCLWCRRLEADTLADGAVRTALAGAVLVDLDVDRGGRQRAASLGVEGPPTTVVLSPAGVERGRVVGYLPPADYLARLAPLLGAS